MSTGIPAGPGSFSFADPRPGPRREITIFTYHPTSFEPSSPILIVMHGRNRNGADYRDWFGGEAERHGFLVAAPEFTEAQYAHPHEYNYGAMIRPDGSWRPREEWIVAAIEALFDELVRRSGSAPGLCDLRPLRRRSARAPPGDLRMARTAGARRDCQCG